MADLSQTYDNLYQELCGIRDERAMHSNTATRVGSALIELLDYAKMAADTAAQSMSEEKLQDYLDDHGYLNENSLSAWSWWGAHAVNGVVSGDMTSVGSITMSGRLTIGGIVIEYDSGHQSLKFNGNIYATGGVTALGADGQGGGGGGGASVLNDLDDVNTDGAVSGQVLGYDGTGWKPVDALNSAQLADYLTSNGYATQQWVQRQGFLTPSALTGYATKQWVGNNYYISGETIHLLNQSITPLTSAALDGYVPKSGTKWWGQSLNSNGEVKGVLNYVTSIEFTEPTTGTGGYLDFHYNGDTSDFTSRIIEDASGRLNLNNTVWFYKNATLGSNLRVAMDDWPSVSFQTQITNNVAFHSNIYVRGNVHLRNGGGIDMLDSGGTERNVLTFNTHNDLAIGYGTRRAGYSTSIQGSPIYFTVGTADIHAATIDTNGQLYIRQATQGLRIGDGILRWNSSNNSFWVQKADGTAANFYAMGGVSSLGFSNTGNQNVSIGDLTARSISVSDGISDQDNIWYIDVDIFHHDGEVEASYMRASRFYVGTNRYLFLQNNVLKYYDNGTVKTVQLA